MAVGMRRWSGLGNLQAPLVKIGVVTAAVVVGGLREAAVVAVAVAVETGVVAAGAGLTVSVGGRRAGDVQRDEILKMGEDAAAEGNMRRMMLISSKEPLAPKWCGGG